MKKYENIIFGAIMSKFRETTVHGNSKFPIAFYKIEKSHPRYVMNFHWHPEFEIIRIVSGRIELHLGGERFLARAGELYLLPGGTTHMGIPDDCVYECIVFRLEALFSDGELCLDEIDELLSQKLVPRNPLVCSDRLRSISDLLFNAARAKGDGYALAVKGGILSFFGELVGRRDEVFFERSLSGLAVEHERYYVVKKVIKYIQTNCSDHITLAELSDVAGMTPNYFCRFFKKITGCSPIEYLISCRMELAAYQLRDDGLSITDVAFNCGFGDVSHFINTFRERNGVTPLKYRENLKK